MRVYKPKCKQRDGTTRKTQRWYVEFRDHWQVLHRLTAFKDKKATQELARKIEKLVNCRATSQDLDVELSRWLDIV